MKENRIRTLWISFPNTQAVAQRTLTHIHAGTAVRLCGLVAHGSLDGFKLGKM